MLRVTGLKLYLLLCIAGIIHTIFSLEFYRDFLELPLN